MKKMNYKRILLFASTIGLLFACTPDEGKGGLASIEGVVMVQNINNLYEESGEKYPAIDEDVYISYGDSELADDKEATGFNGQYKFSNLTKGDYTIYVYSDDSTNNAKNQKFALSQKISLESKKDEAKAETFTIYKHVDYDDGGAIVTGTVKEHKYSGSVEIYEVAAQDADVYLQFQNGDAILDRARTDANGNFVFNNLIPGKYRVYVYSENQLPADGDSACYLSFEVTSNSDVITLETIDTKNY